MTQAVETPPQASQAVPETPYVGLTPFTERDAPFFFGREKERRLIAANLLASRLTLLYGASGVGKSSVIRAGVQRDFRVQAEEALASGRYPQSLVVVFTGWRDDPIAGLADCLTTSIREILGDLAPEPPPADCALDELLLQWVRRLDERALEVAGPSEFGEPVRTELLVVFDQFEQYFVYHPDEDGPGTFAVEFPRAVNREGLRANFLISLREDAYTMLDRFEGRITNLFASNFRLEHLDEKAATAAIVKPVEKYNELLAAGRAGVLGRAELVQAVIKDVRAGKIVFGQAGGGVVEHGEPEQTRVETPFLQLVMSRLWTEEKEQGSRVLRYETLRRLGGAERIVRRHLDDAMEGLDRGGAGGRCPDVPPARHPLGDSHRPQHHRSRRLRGSPGRSRGADPPEARGGADPPHDRRGAGRDDAAVRDSPRRARRRRHRVGQAIRGEEAAGRGRGATRP